MLSRSVARDRRSELILRWPPPQLPPTITRDEIYLHHFIISIIITAIVTNRFQPTRKILVFSPGKPLGKFPKCVPFSNDFLLMSEESKRISLKSPCGALSFRPHSFINPEENLWTISTRSSTDHGQKRALWMGNTWAVGHFCVLWARFR